MLGASLFATRAAAQALGALPVLEAASARFRAAPAMCADFSQELSNPLLGQTWSGRGRLCQKQPDLFSMRFSDPEGDRIVADGQFLWLYTPSTNAQSVLRSPMSSASGAFDFHREFLENPGQKYEARLDGQETLDGNATHRIAVVPRQPTGYRDAILWIDVRSSLVRRVQIREENGSVRTVSLTNIDMGASPSADTFRFVPPQGTQILTP